MADVQPAAPEAQQPEAPAAEPVIEYRRPQGRNVPEAIRAALDGAEEASKPAEAKPDGKPEAKEAEKAPEPEPEEKPPHKSASQLHAEALRRARRAKELEERVEQKVKASEERAQAAEAKLAELEALDEMAVLQRVAERKGLTLEQLIKRGIARVANKGQLPPEEQTRAEIEAARKKADEAAAEVAALKKEREEETAKSKEVEAENVINGWKDQAARMALANEDRLPLLTALPPEEIAERAYAVMSAYYEATKAQAEEEAAESNWLGRQNENRPRGGIVPSHEDVLLYLEQQEQADFERKEARRRKLQKPSQETESPAPGSAIPAQQSRQSRTLTNRDASERASSRKKATSERDLIAYAAEAIPD